MTSIEPNKDKIIFPDQLNITINTSIPGYKKIKFNSSMLNKTSSGKNVMFNPLMELNENTILKIPKDYRIKDFFDKNSFQGLLSRMKKKPASSLVQATRNGYVDNNIKITLDTLFPVNSVIYIANNPYAIADVQWTTGDWKIETKYDNRNPQNYSQLVRQQFINGQNQLKQIPAGLTVGKNYSGPLPGVASGVKTPTFSKKPSSVAGPPSPPQVTTTPGTGMTGPTPPPQVTTTPVTGMTGPTPPPQVTTTPGTGMTGPPHLVNLPTSVSPDFFELPVDIGNQVLSTQDEQLFEAFKNNLQENTNATEFLFKYFSQKDFFQLNQNICSNLTPELSDNIKKFYSLITNRVSRRQDRLLDPKLYISACQNTSVLSAPSDGDCFFKAVSDGINIYNYENQTRKIFFNNYGSSQLFTIAVLREIVYRYIISLGVDTVNGMLEIAQVSVQEFNDRFKQAIDSIKSNNGIVTTDEYLTELKNVYNLFDNFLIYKPSTVPVDSNEYDSPFRVLREDEVEGYIKSKNYWANNVAIEAMCSTLNICVVPIKEYETALGIGNNIMLQSFFADKDIIERSCSQKVMFLLHRGNHYELIKFNYLIKPLITSNVGKWYTIFENDNLIPPLNILLLIFGSAYVNLDYSTRSQFSIYKDILENMEMSVVKIFDDCFNKDQQKLETFNNTFNKYFPNNRTISENLGINDIFGNCSSAPIVGGAPYKNPPYGYYGYPPQQPGYPSRYGYPQQPGYPSRYGYPQQLGYPSRYGYPQQLGYPSRYGYPQQPGYPLPYGYSSRYGYSPYYYKRDMKESQLAYAINIDMELYPGKSLSEEQLKKSKCNSRYNAVKKAFSNFTGIQYKIPSPYNKTAKNTTNVKNISNKTRRIIPPPAVQVTPTMGGNKTRKIKY